MSWWCKGTTSDFPKVWIPVRIRAGIFVILGVWRIAHDPAKVGDQVRLLTRILDAGAKWPGNRLQPGFKWVRFPPASLTANCRTLFQMIRSGQFGRKSLSHAPQRAFQRWLNQAN